MVVARAHLRVAADTINLISVVRSAAHGKPGPNLRAGGGMAIPGRTAADAHGAGRYGTSNAASGWRSDCLGGFCKESAVLLPAYAFLIELTILRFAARSATDRRKLWAIFCCCCSYGSDRPDVASAANATSIRLATRPFTLEQRLLTETRVLVDYAVWTLFPHPAFPQFYHDDIPLSQGWLSHLRPWVRGTMLSSIGAAIALGRKLPLVGLASAGTSPHTCSPRPSSAGAGVRNIATISPAWLAVGNGGYWQNSDNYALQRWALRSNGPGPLPPRLTMRRKE